MTESAACPPHRLLQQYEARAEAEEYLLRGMSREQLEQMMANVFRAADSDGSGYLDRSEFRNCLKSAELGLTKKDINMLMAEVDIDGDGKITYDEFVPLCFNVLVERFKDNIIQDRAYNSTDGLESLLVDAFGDGFASHQGASQLPGGSLLRDSRAH